jgi:hypothetical protein
MSSLILLVAAVAVAVALEAPSASLISSPSWRGEAAARSSAGAEKEHGAPRFGIRGSRLKPRVLRAKLGIGKAASKATASTPAAAARAAALAVSLLPALAAARKARRFDLGAPVPLPATIIIMIVMALMIDQ